MTKYTDTLDCLTASWNVFAANTIMFQVKSAGFFLSQKPHQFSSQSWHSLNCPVNVKYPKLYFVLIT